VLKETDVEKNVINSFPSRFFLPTGLFSIHKFYKVILINNLGLPHPLLTEGTGGSPFLLKFKQNIGKFQQKWFNQGNTSRNVQTAVLVEQKPMILNFIVKNAIILILKKRRHRLVGIVK